MNELLNGLDYVRTYVDGLLIISNKSFNDHINKLEIILSKLNQKDFKVNVKQSFFARNELEYLRFRITRQGIMHLPDKVEAMKSIAVPNTKKQLRSFIGLIDYYRDMWQHSSKILRPLSSMTSKQAKLNWSKECQKTFDTIFLEKLCFPIQTLMNHLKSIRTQVNYNWDQLLDKKVNPSRSIAESSILHRSIILPQNVNYFQL